MIANVDFYHTPYSVDDKEFALNGRLSGDWFIKRIEGLKMDWHPYVKRMIKIPWDLPVLPNYAVINEAGYFVTVEENTRSELGLFLALVYDPIYNHLEDRAVFSAMMEVGPVWYNRYHNPVTVIGTEYYPMKSIPLNGIERQADYTTPFWVEVSATKNTATGEQMMTRYGMFCLVYVPVNSGEFYPAVPYSNELPPAPSSYPSFYDIMSTLQEKSGLQSSEIIAVTASRRCPYAYERSGPRYNLIDYNTTTVWGNSVVYVFTNLCPRRIEQEVFNSSALTIVQRKSGLFAITESTGSVVVNINNIDARITSRVFSDPMGMEEVFYLDGAPIATTPCSTIPWVNDAWVDYVASGKLEYDRQIAQNNIQYQQQVQRGQMYNSAVSGMGGGVVAGALVGGPLGALVGGISFIAGLFGQQLSNNVVNDATVQQFNGGQIALENMVMEQPAILSPGQLSAVLREHYNPMGITVSMPRGIEESNIDARLAVGGHATYPTGVWTVTPGPWRGKLLPTGSVLNIPTEVRAVLNVLLSSGVLLR